MVGQKHTGHTRVHKPHRAQSASAERNYPGKGGLVSRKVFSGWWLVVSGQKRFLSLREKTEVRGLVQREVEVGLDRSSDGNALTLTPLPEGEGTGLILTLECQVWSDRVPLSAE